MASMSLLVACDNSSNNFSQSMNDTPNVDVDESLMGDAASLSLSIQSENANGEIALRWQLIESASDYRLTIQPTNGEKVELYTQGETSFSFDTTTEETYRIKVDALTDIGEVLITSPWLSVQSTVVQATLQETAP